MPAHTSPLVRSLGSFHLQTSAKEGFTSRFFATTVIAVVLTLSSASVGHAQQLSLDLIGGVSTSTLHVEGASEANIGSRIGATVGARVSLDLGSRFALIAGAIYFQKGGTLLENGLTIERDDLNFVDFPLLVKYSLPTSAAGTVKLHVAAGPALEPDFIWGGVGLCLIALAGIDIRVGRGSAILDIAYNHGVSDLEYTSLGRSLRNRTLSFMAGFATPLGSLW